MRRVLLLVMLLISTPAAAQQQYFPWQVTSLAIITVIRPGFDAFAAKAHELKAGISALCAAPSATALDAAREKFRETVIAWSRVEFLRLGPLMEANRTERILFWPDRKGIALRQVQAILADEDETATSLSSLQGKSVAVQGLGALEFVLFGTGAEELATDADFRCRYAGTIAEAMAVVADELVTLWAEDGAITDRMMNPTAEDAEFRTEIEALESLAGIVAFGFEAIRDTRLLPFLGRHGAEPRPRSALFWRSGMTVPSIKANFDGLRELFTVSHMGEATGEDGRWIKDSVQFEFDNVDRAAAQVTEPVETALTDPRQRQALDYLVILSGSLQTLVGESLSAALGLSVGFSSLDGD